MDDFTYDVIEKKRVARGARYRKCGSKSKRCVMPSDFLTEAERRRLNGPVKSYNLNAPMKWAEFKAMPDDLQMEYLENISERFRASSASIARECLGVAPSVLKRHLDDRRRKLPTFGARMNNVEKGVWLAWVTGTIEDAVPETVPEGWCADEERVQLDPPEEIKPKTDERPAEEMEMLDCIVQCSFVGEVTAKSLMRALARITVPEGVCRVAFHVEKLPGGQ